MLKEDVERSLLCDTELKEWKLRVCLRFYVVLVNHKVFDCLLVRLRSIFGDHLEVNTLWIYFKLVPNFSISFLKALLPSLVRGSGKSLFLIE